MFAHFSPRALQRISSRLTAAGLLLALSGTIVHAGPQNVLPTPVKGWKQLGKTKLYNGSNLFDLVDGEAEAIKTYAFSACAYAEYAPAGQSKPNLTISVFDMSDPLNAFGLFGSDRMSGKPIAIGAEGVLIEPTGLNFWKNRYVVRSVIFKTTPANKAALQAFARATAAKITGASGTPTIVKMLPGGKQPRSERYIRQDVAGQSFLKNAVAARYPSLGQGAELFIAQYPNPAGAKAALAAYRSYEKKNPGLTPLKGVGEEGFRVVDRFAKNIVAARKGRYVVGMHHAKDAASAQRLVMQTVVKLK